METVVGHKIDSFSTLKKALDKRMDYFAAHGCTISDHGLEQIRYTETSDEMAEALGMTSNAVRVALSRSRVGLRDCINLQLKETTGI